MQDSDSSDASGGRVLSHGIANTTAVSPFKKYAAADRCFKIEGPTITVTRLATSSCSGPSRSYHHWQLQLFQAPSPQSRSLRLEVLRPRLFWPSMPRKLGFVIALVKWTRLKAGQHIRNMELSRATTALG